MTKLNHVRVVDVLSHKDSSVDIAPCLTVFTGKSDAGKSTMVRALFQALKNKPAGINLLRHAAKHGANAETVITGTDHSNKPFTIVRRRGKSKNEYELGNETFKAFGLTVPSEIEALLNLSDHAFHLQSDGHFLLSSNDGDVAKVLGQTVGLSKIDAAFSNIRTLKAENDSNLRLSQRDVERETGLLAGYDRVGATEILVCLAEESLAIRGKLYSKVADIFSDLLYLATFPPNVDVEDARTKVEKLNIHEKQCVGLGNTKRDREAYTNALANVPNNVSTSSAIICFNCLKTAIEFCEITKAKNADLQKGVNDLISVPKNVDVSCIQPLIYQLEFERNKHWGLLQDVDKLTICFANLHCIRPDATSSVDLAKAILEDVGKHSAKVETLGKKMSVIDGFITLFMQCNSNIALSLKDLRGTELAIDIYRKEHTTCPECGAEQKNWETTKEGTEQ